LASGAGSASRWSLGTAVFGGLLVSTFSSLLLVPVLYVVVKNLTDNAQGKSPESSQPDLKSDPFREETNPNGEVNTNRVKQEL
jgi:hydrophobic/amphiphilic exporter-1 (mainly G- bacteria), HAE1 family